MVIKEPDDHPTKNQTSLFDVDNDSENSKPLPASDEEIIYVDSDEYSVADAKNTTATVNGVGDVDYDDGEEEDPDYEGDYGDGERKKRTFRLRKKKLSTH